MGLSLLNSCTDMCPLDLWCNANTQMTIQCKHLICLFLCWLALSHLNDLWCFMGLYKVNSSISVTSEVISFLSLFSIICMSLLSFPSLYSVLWGDDPLPWPHSSHPRDWCQHSGLNFKWLCLTNSPVAMRQGSTSSRKVTLPHRCPWNVWRTHAQRRGSAVRSRISWSHWPYPAHAQMSMDTVQAWAPDALFKLANCR